jgi:hypothetical protein
MTRHKRPILGAVMSALALAACGGTATVSTSSAPPAASVTASKPAAASASVKPAASAASAKPAASGAPAANAKPAASGELAPPPESVRTPVVEVAKVPPGPPTPQVAQPFGAAPVSSRPPLPAALSQPIGPYVMYMETIASAAPSTAGLLAVPGCVDDSIFKRGMRVVFRYSIWDRASGKAITDRDGSTTKVQLGTNQSVDGFFAPRGAPPPPPNAPWTWVAVWNVPTDFPLGNVDPTVTLSSGGKTTTLKTSDFNAMPIQIVD